MDETMDSPVDFKTVLVILTVVKWSSIWVDHDTCHSTPGTLGSSESDADYVWESTFHCSARPTGGRGWVYFVHCWHFQCLVCSRYSANICWTREGLIMKKKTSRSELCVFLSVGCKSVVFLNTIILFYVLQTFFMFSNNSTFPTPHTFFRALLFTTPWIGWGCLL